MPGRLIDQLLPTSVWEPDEAALVRSMKNKNVKLRRCRQDQPWRIPCHDFTEQTST
jgi:hypothetical protein